MGILKVRLNQKLIKVKMKKGISILDVMHQLGVSRETHLAKRNGVLVSELEGVGSKDKIEIFGVVYGG
jgi:sulfur carrier protein ThiS